jgi:hypothetical protein
VRFDSKPTFRAFPLGLALFAVFRFVDESLFLKELLFTRRKNKHHTTTYTQDISVSKGHNPPSKLSRFREGSTGDSSPSVKTGSVSGILYLLIWKIYTDLKQALSRCVVCARSQSSFKKSALSSDDCESLFFQSVNLLPDLLPDDGLKELIQAQPSFYSKVLEVLAAEVRCAYFALGTHGKARNSTLPNLRLRMVHYRPLGLTLGASASTCSFRKLLNATIERSFWSSLASVATCSAIARRASVDSLVPKEFMIF